VRALIIVSRFPFPLDKGDKLRLFHQVKFLSQFVDLDLFCLYDEPIHKDSLQIIQPYFKNIYSVRHSFWDKALGLLNGLFKGWPLSVAYFYNKKALHHLNVITSNQTYDVFYCQLIRMFPYVMGAKTPCLLDFMDAFSLSFDLRSKNSSNYIYRLLFARESKLISSFETSIQNDFELGTAISERDAQVLNSSFRHKIQVVPNGVDIGFFNPLVLPEPNNKYDIVFVGNLGYFPNIQASFSIVNHILPLLLKDFPNIRILLAGARPGSKIRSLSSKNVEVVAWLEDIRWAYQNAKVFVVPLFTGAGLQNKMLEAMSMSLPCITTNHVNVSLGANDGQHLLIANDVLEFAEKIKTLLLDEVLRTNLGQNARQFVNDNFTWEKSNKKLLSLFEEIAHN
jgi:polysaccharide biosynthesis protein PslH